LSNFGAAGLVSRWVNVESSVDGPYAQGGYKGRAFGIAQWLGARLAPIKGNTSFEAQLAYVIQELNGPEARAGSILRSANIIQAGATGASMYERASGYNSATGQDNYTARTAAGIPKVFSLVTGAAQAAPETATEDSVSGSDVVSEPSSIEPLLIVAAIGIGLFLLTR